MKLNKQDVIPYRGNVQIDLSNNSLTDFTALKSGLDHKTRTHLLYLNLADNILQSVKTLQHFSNLWVLDLTNNPDIYDYSSLSTLKVLGQLSISAPLIQSDCFQSFKSSVKDLFII